MDDDIKLPAHQPVLELESPEGLCAEVVKWGDLVLVPHGGHGVDFEVYAWVKCLQLSEDLFCLHHGELGATGADVDWFGGGGGHGWVWGGGWCMAGGGLGVLCVGRHCDGYYRLRVFFLLL